MNSYQHLHKQIRILREQGLTYTAINTKLGVNIHKSSLSYICKGIVLTTAQKERIRLAEAKKLPARQKLAVAKNKLLFNERVLGYRNQNLDIAMFIKYPNAKLLALAMLYLGEGAKWQGRRGPALGSSDPNIIKLYIGLLRDCYGIDGDALKFRVQHRADQNSEVIVAYWSKIVQVPIKSFYPSYVDKRTIGQKTKKHNYRGVCTVSCAGTHIQLELEQIAGIIFEAV